MLFSKFFIGNSKRINSDGDINKQEMDERLKNVDPKMIEMIQNEVIFVLSLSFLVFNNSLAW